MQVFHLPGRVSRTAQLMSRLIGAKAPDSEAAIRRDIVHRWRQAIREVLCAAEPKATAGAPAALVAGTRRSGRGTAARQPHVGQAQDRRAARPRRLHDLRLDGRAQATARFAYCTTPWCRAPLAAVSAPR